jgi:hypothetical protein
VHAGPRHSLDFRQVGGTTRTPPTTTSLPMNESPDLSHDRDCGTADFYLREAGP